MDMAVSVLLSGADPWCTLLVAASTLAGNIVMNFNLVVHRVWRV